MLRNLREIMGGRVEHALVRLWSEELSEPEAAAIYSRLQGDPEYRDEFRGSMGILARMEELAEDGEIAGILREHRLLLRERRTKRRVALSIAFGVLVAIGAALSWFAPPRAPDDSQLQRHFTRIGEQQTIELDDGSIVTLNTGGQLVVDYSGRDRRIMLERGEAYFDVADVTGRPFTVDLGVRSVTAVGTAFNIRKHPEGCQIAVIEGAVALHEESADVLSASPPPFSASWEDVVISAPSRHLVEAGWVVEFDERRNELKAYRPESMDRYQQWRSGMLSFYREPLYRVVKELNRYSRKKILIEDTSVMELKVYTAVSVHDIDSALKGLELALPIKVTRHYDRFVVSGAAGN
ncbi:MAG: FecR domain-containing protein [Gammaproteobacteria bacterium]|nr:FecR domain-containing protein [Gammaproteobacteria bacterium]